MHHQRADAPGPCRRSQSVASGQAKVQPFGMLVTDMHHFLDLPEDEGEDRTSPMAAGGRWSRPPSVIRSSGYPDRIHVVTSLGFGRKRGQATKGNR